MIPCAGAGLRRVQRVFLFNPGFSLESVPGPGFVLAVLLAWSWFSPSLVKSRFSPSLSSGLVLVYLFNPVLVLILS